MLRRDRLKLVLPSQTGRVSTHSRIRYFVPRVPHYWQHWLLRNSVCRPPCWKASRRWATSNRRPFSCAPFPLIMAGQDVIGSAQTGTGKTAAFALPILTTARTSPAPHASADPGTDTRTGRAGGDGHSRLRALHRYAGRGRLRRRRLRPAELDALKRGVDVLVATPGRLLDHCGQAALVGSTTSPISSSTKPTGCWTWASCPT